MGSALANMRDVSRARTARRASVMTPRAPRTSRLLRCSHLVVSRGLRRAAPSDRCCSSSCLGVRPGRNLAERVNNGARGHVAAALRRVSLARARLERDRTGIMSDSTRGTTRDVAPRARYVASSIDSGAEPLESTPRRTRQRTKRKPPSPTTSVPIPTVTPRPERPQTTST
jgi:hypothetical protein